MSIQYAVLLTNIVCFSNCANILGILPSPSYSHQIVFQKLWAELSLRGHQVTVITPDPQNNASLVNLTEIDTSRSYRLINSEPSISEIAENLASTWTIYELMSTMFLNVANDTLSHPKVQELLQTTTKFDVVLSEFMYPQLLPFGNLLNCPVIVVSSVDVFEFIHTSLGNPSHPAVNPYLYVGAYGRMSLKERLMSSIFSVYVYFYTTFKEMPLQQQQVDKYFNTSVRIQDLLYDIDMLFINTNPNIHNPRALGPSTINIGQKRQVVLKKSIPKDLKEFLDNAKEGFVYFSLGSNVKSRELNKDTFQSIIGALRELPYKVLYKYEDEDMPGKPDNVKVVTWAPQQYILRHPNIKVFVTQGGVQSMEEAIYSSVPTVVIPFFADQEQNAKLMKNRGIGLIVDRSPLRKEELKSAILEVIQNPSYKKAVTKLNELAQDEPMTGLERAIWWTEYVIRHKGAKHLRNPAADLPWYQFYLLDVLSIVAVVAIAIIALVVFLIKLLSRLFTSILLSKDSKKKKL